MVLTAFGTFSFGFSDSPAATPIISVPWNEKPAIMKMPRTAAQPPTNGASPTVQLVNPGDSAPIPRINNAPTKRNTMTVMTFTPAKINSLSPNKRVDI